jgi:hypothetical protein
MSEYIGRAIDFQLTRIIKLSKLIEPTGLPLCSIPMDSRIEFRYGSVGLRLVLIGYSISGINRARIIAFNEEAPLALELDDIDSLLCRAQSRAAVSNNLTSDADHWLGDKNRGRISNGYLNTTLIPDSKSDLTRYGS